MQNISEIIASPDRRNILRTMGLIVPALGTSLVGCASPGTSQPAPVDWSRHASLAEAGLSPLKMKSVEAVVFPLETSSMLILKKGKIAYSYGDIDTPSYLASARKSILAMLFGKYVLRGTINLDRTMGDLGIDDIGVLTTEEKTATIRDLLTARSGVFHAAGSPGSSSNGPVRGSHTRGSYFYYNNWDFNVIGAIFEKLTGKSIFEAFRDDLAIPLRLQDFDFNRQRMLGFKPARSKYLAYHFFLSCRDMARIGQLVANRGNWYGQQLIAAEWIDEMTKTRVSASETRTDSGYAYLWWKPDETRTGAAWRGSSMALGNYGQNILVMPAVDMVIVHRRYVTDEFAIARNLGETNTDKTGVSNTQFMQICDLIVGALV
jgi:CubicO group peptidase (beta-lactamase class C family)